MYPSASESGKPGFGGNAGQTASGPIVVLGNPENRRVRMFCDAARRLGLAPPETVAYESVLSGAVDLRQAVPPGALVRIESPGENEQVERALVALGAGLTPGAELPAGYCPDDPIEFGQIYHPRLWYRGFCHLLRRCQQDLSPIGVRWMNHPADIPVLFDKNACQELLERNGVPVPRRLGSASGYEELRARMRDAAQPRVFVKLTHGSSASGVVALGASGARLSAVTSVEIVRVGGQVRLYNSLRLRHYSRDRDVADLLDALCPLGVHIEAWVPKAGWNGSTFDLRILVIAGQVRHLVVRTSRSPITNLHLGNRRGDAAALVARLPGLSFQQASDSCRRVADLFPRSLYLGIDLMFTPKLRRHAVLEVNAFGDLLPGVVHRGEDTYAGELIEAWRQRRNPTKDGAFPGGGCEH